MQQRFPAAQNPPAHGPALVVALGILSAVNPMATDMYLASIPELAEDFGVGIAAVQLSLSTYMVGMALGQFILGPLSDVLGRHRLLLAGTSVFLLASAAIAFSSNLPVMLALRGVQGFSGAAGVVIARAVVSDIASGAQAAKLYSMLGTIISIAPIIAPVIGGIIAGVAPWPVVFWLLAGFGAIMVACVVLIIPETLPPERRRPGGLSAALKVTVEVARHRRFLLWVCVVALNFGSLFSYVSASSFVMQNVVGLSSLHFSFAFAAAAAGAVVSGLLNVRLLGRFSTLQIFVTAIAAQWAINAAGLAGVLLGAADWTIVAHTIAAQSCFGFLMGNGIAMAQAQVPGRAGAGSAVQGLIQFIVGGAVSPLVGAAGDDTAVPMSAAMFVFTSASLILALRGRRLLMRDDDAALAS